MSDDDVKIKVFTSDDNLKALGELLSNDSSRNIIYNLMTQEMYTNEIATKLDMRVSLVIHHLKKLEDLGLLEISEKRIKRKGIDHRFFKIKSNIFVVLDQDKTEIEEKGLLSRIFKDGTKFASIVIAGISMWFLSVYEKTLKELQNSSDESIVSSESSLFVVLEITIVVSVGLFLIWYSKK